MKEIEKLILSMPLGLIAWYPFKANTKVLCIEDRNGIYSSFLQAKKETVLSLTIKESANKKFLEQAQNKFDYIIAIGVLEQCQEPEKMLQRWKSVLKTEGVLLLGCNNRLGLRYFVGDIDPYTGRVFDGIENYCRYDKDIVNSQGGRLYAKYELLELLDQVGYQGQNRKIYSVLSGLETPQLIYAENCLPKESLSMRYIPMYGDASNVFMDEGNMYESIIKNGTFHQMANAYIVECTSTDAFAPVSHITLSMDRSKDDAYATVVREDNIVEKCPLYLEGYHSLQRLKMNTQELSSRGLPMVEIKILNGKAIMPFINAPTLDVYMQEILTQDSLKFIELMDRFRDIILKSSDVVEENERGIILKKGYIDLVPLNCFFINDDFLFFDQEFYFDNFPANAIIHRAISIIYAGDIKRNEVLSATYFYERYGLNENADEWWKYSCQFTDKLRNQKNLKTFNLQHGRNYLSININRERMNVSELCRRLEELDCFEESEKDKSIYLFGAGSWVNKFLQMYGSQYPVEAIIDNSEEKWGKFIEIDSTGEKIYIQSPEELKNKMDSSHRVIICMRQYKTVYFQLLDMGINDVTLYDANRIYKGRQLEGLIIQKAILLNNGHPKKYSVGYISGTFDLFHYGHVRLLQRAKDLCDYLIVTVTSDRYVRDRKQKEPIINEQERLEVVRACRYVDEAAIVPYEYGGIMDAYRKYHFDIQICGSDVANDPWWLEQQKWLQDHGADIVFLSYTEQTSSTKIRESLKPENSY